MGIFKQYLTESTKVYTFKVKIVGEVDKKINEFLKVSLGKFDCTSVKGPKRTPITENPLDFPNAKYSHVNIFDITCNYPTTSQVLAAEIAEGTKINPAHIRVKSEFEELEQGSNLDGFKRIGTHAQSLLSKTELEDVNGQQLVGEKRLGFLQELGKVKHAGEQVKGVNDQLLAKSAPTGSAPEKKGR